jgi:hypothetical protein
MCISIGTGSEAGRMSGSRNAKSRPGAAAGQEVGEADPEALGVAGVPTLQPEGGAVEVVRRVVLRDLREAVDLHPAAVPFAMRNLPVGSSIKQDGICENPVDLERVRRVVESGVPSGR